MPTRRLPVGAEVVPGGVHFRVWAPIRTTVEVVIEAGPTAALAAEGGGYFSALVPGVAAGDRYKFRLDGRPNTHPDLASRYQPAGPHGPSQVVDPAVFPWTDQDWKGVLETGQVFYEMHVGTFTPDGTFAAAADKLPELAALGVTAVEVMPVAEFPGEFGWGYDGVHMFAPTRLYGTPDDFRRFVDRAHALGLGVILDVVYNHFGPSGNYTREYSPQFFSTVHKTDWGEPFNFDGPDSGPVREFFVANAGYWVDEFHLDGLRLDATQAIFDDSKEYVVTSIARRAREAGRGKSIYVVAENEPQDARLARPSESGGSGLNALWNDDLHHACRVALTARNEGYFSDYLGTPQELISAAKYGFLYQGQRYRWHARPRGRAAFDLKPHNFVAFLENHDQVANSCRGLRLNQLASPGKLRALTAYLLLGPATPMLFQGQEWASTRPFLYFAHHEPDLAKLVHEGRRGELKRFRSQSSPAVLAQVADPAAAETFFASKLDWSERERRRDWLALHTDLLAVRKTDPAFHPGVRIDGAVISPAAFVLRYIVDGTDDRLLVVNLGRDLKLDPIPEPLLAPPDGATRWAAGWSSEEPSYGGHGTAPLDTDLGWLIPGESAVWLAGDRGV
ncbi:malto-oligosyltrehalose trehalohydrolase [Urbifossiella limnaea]|uniref:Malto-oligosyltrehalose trehalohydrolase n=1 Tax=Urbifossiella limnaea TaxID=2528023 RepID=A0A517XXW4_9BACT|nr:malto-oligosyltrehalose trehalohydrolase [Urbifossiella limnaea]QDU22334.1 Malto-oligosyltrehalose trehalohydrolase [Urbifossiella limnaea]